MAVFLNVYFNQSGSRGSSVKLPLSISDRHHIKDKIFFRLVKENFSNSFYYT
jgi:hypothetical protein